MPRCRRAADAPLVAGLATFSGCLLTQLAVEHERLVFIRQLPAQLLGDVNRAVLPACAADGDGYIAAVFLADARQPAVEKVGDVAQHFVHKGLGGEVVLDGLVFAVVGA